MCGIVGLFLKDKSLEPSLGKLTSTMLATMCDRGPDSAGFAVYGAPVKGQSKITVQSPEPDKDFGGRAEAISQEIGGKVTISVRSTHAVLSVPSDKLAAARAAIRKSRPGLRIMGSGDVIEIYKEVGYPTDVSNRFALSDMKGTHAIGHTRMATESAVTTLGAHPFSTGPDQCLVHNGSLSNHNNIRRDLKHDGMTFETENDSEVAAGYLTWRLREGDGLEGALTRAIAELEAGKGEKFTASTREVFDRIGKFLFELFVRILRLRRRLFAGQGTFQVIGEHIHHSAVQVSDHLGNLAMLGFEVLEF